MVQVKRLLFYSLGAWRAVATRSWFALRAKQRSSDMPLRPWRSMP